MATPSYRNGLVVVVVGVVLAGWLGLRPQPAATGEEVARTGRPPVSASLAGVELRDTANRAVPLTAPGKPAVLMVSSVTCSWCKRALRDLGELSGGRPLPGLRLLTFEGAAGGVEMLGAARVNGAVSVGPASSSTATIMSLQFPGTPLFLVVDSAGRVTQSIPGYPGREGMVRLMRTMLDSADARSAQGAKLNPK